MEQPEKNTCADIHTVPMGHRYCIAYLHTNA